jgi:hypothetical protein
MKDMAWAVIQELWGLLLVVIALMLVCACFGACIAIMFLVSKL